MSISCEQCGGVCCKVLVVDTSDMNTGRQLLCRLREGTLVDGVMYYDVKCRHLKDGKCLIYDMRPDICREWAVGGPECLAVREAAGL